MDSAPGNRGYSLRDLGISQIKLLVTRQVHYVGLAGLGITIDDMEMIR